MPAIVDIVLPLVYIRDMANFYTDSEGGHKDALRAALQQLRSQATQGNAGVFVMQKGSVVYGNVLGEIIGDEALQRLRNDGTAGYDGLTLVLLTAEDTKVTFAGPVLAMHVTPNALNKLKAAAPKDVIFVPWDNKDVATVLKAVEPWTKIYP